MSEINLTISELASIPEHRYDWPPSLNVTVGKLWKWNSRRFRGRGLDPPQWKVWQAFTTDSNNLDVRLLDVHTPPGCKCGYEAQRKKN